MSILVGEVMGYFSAVSKSLVKMPLETGHVPADVCGIAILRLRQMSGRLATHRKARVG